MDVVLCARFFAKDPNYNELMTVERIHPKAPVMLIFIAIFTCLPSCINLSNTNYNSFMSTNFVLRVA